MRALRICLLVAFACGTGRANAADTDRVRVKAAIRTDEGSPYGARFVVFAATSHEVLFAGATDNYGEVDVEVTPPLHARALVLLVESKGMVRNASDERDVWAFAAREPTRALPRVMQQQHWVGFMLPYGLTTANPAELIRAHGEEHRVIHGTRGHWIETVAIREHIGGDPRSVDFGTVKLRITDVSVELRIRVEHKGDHAPIFCLGGFLGSDELGANRVYPHMALAQRGDEIRILLTRAARRLLLSDPNEFLILVEPGARKPPLAVPLPARTWEKIGGGASDVAFTLDIDDGERKEAWTDRPPPDQPRFWDLGEPSFRE